MVFQGLLAEIVCFTKKNGIRRYTEFFDKSKIYKNTEVRFAKKSRTHPEHAQPQMRVKKAKMRILKFHNVIL